MKNQQNDFCSRFDYGNLTSNIRFLQNTSVFNKQKCILEIGSGSGSLLDFFYKKGYNIRGVEVNKRLIEKSKTIYGKLPVCLVEREGLPFGDNMFDVVISFDVFEHIPDSDNHLAEVRRVLKEDGFYLLQTPNKLTNVIFETLRWKSLTNWRERHCSLHSYRQLIDRFGKNGLDVRFYEIPVVNEFFKNKVNKYLGKFGSFLLKVIKFDSLPIAFRPNFYVAASKYSKYASADFQKQ